VLRRPGVRLAPYITQLNRIRAEISPKPRNLDIHWSDDASISCSSGPRFAPNLPDARGDAIIVGLTSIRTPPADDGLSRPHPVLVSTRHELFEVTDLITRQKFTLGPAELRNGSTPSSSPSTSCVPNSESAQMAKDPSTPRKHRLKTPAAKAAQTRQRSGGREAGDQEGNRRSPGSALACMITRSHRAFCRHSQLHATGQHF
jgi:hypothetical protein